MQWTSCAEKQRFNEKTSCLLANLLAFTYPLIHMLYLFLYNSCESTSEVHVHGQTLSLSCCESKTEVHVNSHKWISLCQPTEPLRKRTVAAFYPRYISNCVCYRHCLPPFSLRIRAEIIYKASYTRVESYGITLIFLWDIRVCLQLKCLDACRKS